MSSTRFSRNLMETSQEVCVPRVGRMIRIERRSSDGEVLDIEYRWPIQSNAHADGISRVAG